MARGALFRYTAPVRRMPFSPVVVKRTVRPCARVALVALALLAASSAITAASGPALHAPPTQEERRRVRAAMSQGERAGLSIESLTPPPPSPVDVQRYTLNLRITLPSATPGRVDGTVRIQARVAAQA